MEKVYNIIVIGAGASGMMTVANLHNKQDVLILDSNSKPGVKISISGGGKCNLTNKDVDASNYIGDQRFISRVFKEYNNRKIIEWFQSRGVELEERKKGQLFCRKSAMEIVDVLQFECNGAEFVYECKVNSVASRDGIFFISTSRGEYFARTVVVASGGLSYPKIGASSIGYEIGSITGHKISTLSAGLVGMTLQAEQAWGKESEAELHWIVY